jgi:hypothetical protein
MEIIRYFVIRNQEGIVTTLARVLENDTRLWGECLSAGQWVKNHVATNFLIDPLMGDEITYREAQEIARQMGYEI